MARRTISYSDDLDEWVQAQIDADVYDGYSDAFRTALRNERHGREPDHTDSHAGERATNVDPKAAGVDHTEYESGLSGLDDAIADLETRLDALEDAGLRGRIADLEARLAAIERGLGLGGGNAREQHPDPAPGDAEGVHDRPGPRARDTHDTGASTDGNTAATSRADPRRSATDGTEGAGSDVDLETVLAPSHWLGDPDSAKAVGRRHEAVVDALEWLRDEADDQSARRGEFLTANEAGVGVRHNRDAYWERTLEPALEYAVEIGLVDHDPGQGVYRWRGLESVTNG